MYQWGGRFRRLPEGFILTARATAIRPAVKRTPKQAYFRWHLANMARMLPAIKMTDTNDYCHNQKKRFSEWKKMCVTFDKYLAQCGIVVAAQNPTGEQLAVQFAKAITIHFEHIAVFHPCFRKRQQRRNGEVASKVSTVYTEIRKMEKRIRKAKTLYQLTTAVMALQTQFRMVFNTK